MTLIAKVIITMILAVIFHLETDCKLILSVTIVAKIVKNIVTSAITTIINGIVFCIYFSSFLLFKSKNCDDEILLILQCAVIALMICLFGAVTAADVFIIII